MDNINNNSNLLLKIDLTTKIKEKTLKQVKSLKGNNFIDIKLCYLLKATDPTSPRFYGQPKLRSQEFLYILLFHIVACHFTILKKT